MWCLHDSPTKARANSKQVSCVNTGGQLMDRDENDLYKRRLTGQTLESDVAHSPVHKSFGFHFLHLWNGIVTLPISWCCCGRNARSPLSTAPAYSKRSINSNYYYFLSLNPLWWHAPFVEISSNLYPFKFCYFPKSPNQDPNAWWKLFFYSFNNKLTFLFCIQSYLLTVKYNLAFRLIYSIVLLSYLSYISILFS